MNLAKHEVPKARGMVLNAGYARIDLVRGTLYWQFIAPRATAEIGPARTANFFLISGARL